MRSNAFYVPSFFTLLNFFWGFFSMVKVVEGDLHGAAWFIVLAIVCDGMDGKLARWTGSETSFGFELDSLADLVSAGLAPAFLVYVGNLEQFGVLGILVGFFYLFAGGYRLARFNVQQAGDRSRGYVGLPIPVAGMTVASLWLFQSPLAQTVAVGWWVALLLFLTVLMVSTVPYDWPRLVFRGRWWQVLQSGGLLLATGTMAVFPHKSLFPLFFLYVLLGVRRWLVALLRGEVGVSDFFLSAREQ